MYVEVCNNEDDDCDGFIDVVDVVNLLVVDL